MWLTALRDEVAATDTTVVQEVAEADLTRTAPIPVKGPNKKKRNNKKKLSTTVQQTDRRSSISNVRFCTVHSTPGVGSIAEGKRVKGVWFFVGTITSTPLVSEDQEMYFVGVKDNDGNHAAAATVY